MYSRWIELRCADTYLNYTPGLIFLLLTHFRLNVLYLNIFSVEGLSSTPGPPSDFCSIESYVFTCLLGKTYTLDKYGRVAAAH